MSVGVTPNSDMADVPSEEDVLQVGLVPGGSWCTVSCMYALVILRTIYHSFWCLSSVLILQNAEVWACSCLTLTISQ